MIHGRNQNLCFRGREFHVQTEDSGAPNHFVTTHIYVGGTIIASTRTDYSPLADSDEHHALVKQVMEEQHDLMARKLRSGHYGGGEVPGRAFACVLGDDTGSADPDDVIAGHLADGLAALL